MKLGRRIILVILIALLLAVPASAHPGATDSQGGHWDRSTGEYHYHHGYPAHQHEDLDGDGYSDCPYDFDDRTGKDSGSSSSKSNAPTNPPINLPKPTTVTKPPETRPQSSLSELKLVTSDPKKEGGNMDLWVYAAIFGIIVFLIWGFREIGIDAALKKERAVSSANQKAMLDINNKLKGENDILQEKNKDLEDELLDAKSEIERRKENYSSLSSRLVSYDELFNDLCSQLAEAEEKVADLSSQLEKKDTSSIKAEGPENQEQKSYRAKYFELYKQVCNWKHINTVETLRLHGIENIMPDIPQDVVLDTDMMPIKGLISANRPYGDYTVYIRQDGQVYHEKYLCCYASTPVHAFRAISSRRPCKICVTNRDLMDIPMWYKELRKSRYTSRV